MTTTHQNITSRAWTVFTAYYDAPRDDQRLKRGERTQFQASTPDEVREKIKTRGIDPQAHNLIVMAEHFTEESYVTDEGASFR